MSPLLYTRPTLSAVRDAGLVICMIALFASIATAFPGPSTNITITVPDGTSNHGNPEILCTPTKWYDIALFFLGNYIAHAATLKPYPGEAISEMISSMVVTLLFPPSGAVRGLHSIFCAAIFIKDPLKRAARAGALCMVMRSVDWKPEPGQKVDNFSYVTPKLIEEAKVRGRFKFNSNPTTELEEIQDSETPPKFDVINPIWAWTKRPRGIVPYGRSIHGRCKLPPGYHLSFVPEDLQFSDNEGSDEGPKPYLSIISSSNNLGKTLVAALQTLYACFTLYRARGDQLELYGYAAFGLTVAPYAVMGIVNLLGNLATPEYPTMYLVRSDILDEAAKREGAQFDGMVGELITQDVFPMFPRDIAPNLLSGSFQLTSDGKPKPCSDLRSSVPPDTKEEPKDSATKSLPEPAHGLTEKVPCEVTDVHVHVKNEKSSTIVQPGVDLDSGSKAAGDTGGTEKDHEAIFRIPACSNYARSGPLWSPPHVEKVVIDPGKLQFSKKAALLGFFNNFGLVIAIGALPIAIIAALSHFRAGSSTKAQRVWTMSWLAIGIYLGPTIGALPSVSSLLKYRKNVKFDNLSDVVNFQFGMMVTQWVFLCLYAVPAIGGFVVVGQMFHSYGSCIRL